MKNFLEKNLANTPLFGLGKFFYHKGRAVLYVAEKFYLAWINFLLPKSYVVSKVPNYVLTQYTDFRQDLKTYEKAWPYAQFDTNRIFTAKYLFEMVAQLDTGDYAELGTYRGSFARLIYKYKHNSAKLYCFDTFEGFDSQDVEKETAVSGDVVKSGYFSDTSLEDVANYITHSNPKGSDTLILRKGFFPATFAGLENNKWRFVLLDADLYEPQKAGLEKFWDAIVDGGILMIHDYNASYAGSKIATDEFFKNKKVDLIPIADNAGTVFVIKHKS